MCCTPPPLVRALRRNIICVLLRILGEPVSSEQTDIKTQLVELRNEQGKLRKEMAEWRDKAQAAREQVTRIS